MNYDSNYVERFLYTKYRFQNNLRVATIQLPSILLVENLRISITEDVALLFLYFFLWKEKFEGLRREEAGKSI